MSLRIGLNYFSNCPAFWLSPREVRHPLSDNGSNHGDQTAYRAAIDRYYATQSDTPRSRPPSPLYVPPSYPNCTPRCRNGWHDPACSEHR